MGVNRMTSLPVMIKRALGAMATVAALTALATGTLAADFQLRRGLNMDIWTTWPSEQQWRDREVLLPYPEWRRHVDAERLEGLRAAGFDFVRIPVDPAPFLSPASSRLRAELVASVAEAARLANAAGLKAIVDLHPIPRGDSALGTDGILASEAGFEAYLRVVADMAGGLAGADPAEVALELMNEPVIDCGEDENRWPAMLSRLHAAARAPAARLTLVATGACWSDASALARLDPAMLRDENILWTFHSYVPFLLTHQGAEWAGDFIRYATGLTYPLHAMPQAEREAALEAARERIRSQAPWHRRAGMLAYLDEQVALLDTPEKLAAAMRKPFEEAAAWADRHGVARSRVLLGEFGMIRQEYDNPSIVPASSRAAYYRDMIALAEEHGFAWSMWGYGGAFGVVEEFDRRPAEPDVLGVVRGLADR